jgi:opacity protein-like surface antigen
MDKIKSTTVALMLATSFAMAGGDIAPQEPQITLPEVMDEPIIDNYFYTGLAYTYMKMENDTRNDKITGNAITALAGYKFHPYLAIEGRYTTTLGDVRAHGTDNNWDMSNIALYLKPQYALNQVTLYGLLGYGQVELDDGVTHTENGFQWGIGANFAATDSIDVFVDYTRLYDDNGFDDLSPNNDFSVDNINVGVSYNF